MATTYKQQIIVERATISDIPHLIHLLNEALDPEGTIVPHDANGSKHSGAAFQALIQDGKERAKVYVVRDEHGIPISMGTVYRIDAHQDATSVWWNWGVTLEVGVKLEVLDVAFGGWVKRQNLLMNPSPRLFVEALATKTDWRERGCASAILARAAEDADELGYSVYLDTGNIAFYAKRGYTVVSDVSGVEAMDTPMLRAKKSEQT